MLMSDVSTGHNHFMVLTKFYSARYSLSGIQLHTRFNIEVIINMIGA